MTSPDVSATYKRVCVLRDGHEGDHLPYYAAPDEDPFGNKHVEHPRCVHVDPMPVGGSEDRYRVVFEIIDPRMPRAGWHEVVREASLDEALDQLTGLAQLEREGDDVRNARVERATVTWERIEVGTPDEAQRSPEETVPQFLKRVVDERGRQL